MTTFILYSRTYCHLCDDMLEQLQSYSGRYDFRVEVMDVDADEALLQLYDELVPVLVGIRDNGESEQICHYFLDQTKLISFLEK